MLEDPSTEEESRLFQGLVIGWMLYWWKTWMNIGEKIILLLQSSGTERKCKDNWLAYFKRAKKYISPITIFLWLNHPDIICLVRRKKYVNTAFIPSALRPGTNAHLLLEKYWHLNAHLEQNICSEVMLKCRWLMSSCKCCLAEHPLAPLGALQCPAAALQHFCAALQPCVGCSAGAQGVHIQPCAHLTQMRSAMLSWHHPLQSRHWNGNTRADAEAHGLQVAGLYCL